MDFIRSAAIDLGPPRHPGQRRRAGRRRHAASPRWSSRTSSSRRSTSRRSRSAASAQPVDVANAALFLASDEAAYVTGQTHRDRRRPDARDHGRPRAGRPTPPMTGGSTMTPSTPARAVARALRRPDRPRARRGDDAGAAARPRQGEAQHRHDGGEVPRPAGRAAPAHQGAQVARSWRGMQVEAGAVGVACATVWEAIVMAEAGIADVLIANQLIQPGQGARPSRRRARPPAHDRGRRPAQRRPALARGRRGRASSSSC